MQFSVSRKDLIKPLSLAAGVVERRQTLPVLSNILMVVEGNVLTLTGTDLEIELVGRITLTEPAEPGTVTVQARKFLDICKTLPEDADIKVTLDGEKAVVKSGRSRFSLTTLPASDFPNVEQGEQDLEFTIQQGQLKRLIDRTSIAMANGDVRYYLNGMLFEINKDKLITVATDGHRLAVTKAEMAIAVEDTKQVILPRKGVMELAKLVAGDAEESVTLVITKNHLRAVTDSFTFTSKLVEGNYPDYRMVIPKHEQGEMRVDRELIKQTLNRTAILSNEKYRGVQMTLGKDLLQVSAKNPEQEQAEESLQVTYDADDLNIGFNVNYLLDVLSITAGEEIKFNFGDANTSVLIREVAEKPDSVYVVMPMRL